VTSVVLRIPFRRAERRIDYLGSVLLLALFVARETRAAEPILPLRLFRGARGLDSSSWADEQAGRPLATGDDH
jgi:hypothetical protein